MLDQFTTVKNVAISISAVEKLEQDQIIIRDVTQPILVKLRSGLFDNIGLITLIIGTLAISSAALFLRQAENDILPTYVIFHRFWIAALFWGILKQFMAKFYSSKTDLLSDQNIQQEINVSNKIYLLLAGGFLLLTQLLWAKSLVLTTVTNSTLFHNFHIVFLPVIGCMILKISLSKKFITGIVLTFIGMIIISCSDFNLNYINFRGDGLALLSALTMSFYLLSTQKVSAKQCMVTVNFYVTLVAAIAIFPFILFSSTSIFPTSSIGWFSTVGLALICQVIGQGVIAFSLRSVSSLLVAVVMAAEPIITGIGAWIIFQEHLSTLNYLAFIVTFIGICYCIYVEINSKEVLEMKENFIE